MYVHVHADLHWSAGVITSKYAALNELLSNQLLTHTLNWKETGTTRSCLLCERGTEEGICRWQLCTFCMYVFIMFQQATATLFILATHHLTLAN